MEHFPVNCFFLKALACLNSICAWKAWNYICANATPDSPSHFVLPAFCPMHSQFENPLIQDFSSNLGDISFAGHLLSRAVAKTAAPRRTRAWYGRSTNVPGDKGIESLRSLSIFVNLGAGGYTAWLLVLYWSIMYFSTSCNLLLYGMDISISEHIRTTNQIIGYHSDVSHVTELIQNSTFLFHQEFPAAMGARMVGVGNRLLETALSQTRHVVNPSGSDDLREVGWTMTMGWWRDITGRVLQLAESRSQCSNAQVVHILGCFDVIVVPVFICVKPSRKFTMTTMRVCIFSQFVSNLDVLVFPFSAKNRCFALEIKEQTSKFQRPGSFALSGLEFINQLN